MRKIQSRLSHHKVRFGIFLKNRVRFLALCGIALAALSGPDAFAAFNGFRAIKITEGQNGFTGDLNDFDEFGSAVAGIGDIDGDGIGDAAVGARWTPDGGITRGAVWILFLNADHTVRAEQKISSTSGGFTGELENSDYFGSSLTPIGDLNGDSVPDIAVGAPGSEISTGAVWILFLKSDGTVLTQQKISRTQGGFTGMLDDGDSLGQGLGSPGDLDGDGIVDLAVGAPLDDDGAADEGDPFANLGAVYILFLNADGTVKNTQKISQTEGGFTGMLSHMENFGYAVSQAGDVNGDGVVDLVVGTLDSSVVALQGAVWIVFLNADGTVNGQQKISGTEGGFTGMLDESDFFGAGVATVGDLDGDSVPDIAVGAFNDDDGDFNSGAVWILFLESNGTVKRFKKISDPSPGTRNNPRRLSLAQDDLFGSSVSLLGDLDGNGRPELIVGALLDADAGFAAGSAWVVSLGSGGNQ